MKQALYFTKLKDKNVQCVLCPYFCTIKPNETGNCFVRKNIDGDLFSLVYAKPCAIAIDPIEKKPLYHFLPGEKAFSVGTAGCNLHCRFCLNADTAQSRPEEINSINLSPEELVQRAIKNNCKVIAYTYNEPTVFIEYVLDCAKIAKQHNIKNILVSNGFINKEPLLELSKVIDAVNVDLKSMDNSFHEGLCGSNVKPVLEALKLWKQQGVWLEITNLLIFGENDSSDQVSDLCDWIKDNLGVEVPLHFSKFFPCYKMINHPQTEINVLHKAKEIATKKGFKFVYLGNVWEDRSTLCPKCKKVIISRPHYKAEEINIKDNKCIFCDESIKGIF